MAPDSPVFLSVNQIVIGPLIAVRILIELTGVRMTVEQIDVRIVIGQIHVHIVDLDI